jgi:hypothetical protein
VDDDDLANFLRDKAAQLHELSRRLHGATQLSGIPLDDLMRLAHELRRKADALEQAATLPPSLRTRN